jgi:hypothetical protein
MPIPGAFYNYGDLQACNRILTHCQWAPFPSPNKTNKKSFDLFVVRKLSISDKKKTRDAITQPGGARFVRNSIWSTGVWRAALLTV